MNTLLTTRIWAENEEHEVLINLDTVRHFEESDVKGLTIVYFIDGGYYTIKEHFCNIVEMLHDND